MYCSGCGHEVVPGQPVCPQCGRPVAPVVPPIPGLQFQLENYSGKVRALSLVWFLYAAFALLTGIAGLTFAQAFFANRFPFTHGPFSDGNGPLGLGPMIIHFGWTKLMVRTALSLIAGWGLYERAAWGRIVAIVAAFVSLLHFPFGTALGIWTLVVLMGYRNSTLYDQLTWNPQTGPIR
jgi:hypothetical protein